MRFTRLAALALVAAAPASAADFTFDVPVRVENLPSLHTVWVSCAILTAGPFGEIIGRGESRAITMTDGRFDGTVTVEVNAGLTPPSAARTYDCALRGAGTARPGVEYALSPLNFAAVYERATGHTLLRANNTIRGTIP